MSSALAYLDPGSSSSTFELIAIAVAVLAVIAKLFWRRIFSLVHASGDDSDKRTSD